MALDIVRGRITNIDATKQLISSISEIELDGCQGTLYLGYPIAANENGNVTVDALFVSERYGLIAFIFSSKTTNEDIQEEQNELYYQLTNTLTQYQNLRKGKKLAIEPNVFSITNLQLEIIESNQNEILNDFNDLSQRIIELPRFDTSYYSILVESLQRIASIKPKKKRENVVKPNSKGNIIKKIEKEVANLDQWQKKAALEMFDGPQRIRGLAGSGKTIVLALKAAYLHVQYPDWEIVVTYYTRSLWQQYHDLITKFMFELSKDEPNWDKIHLFHAWGSQSEQGLYSEIARSINVIPYNFSNASLKYGRENAFSSICNELSNLIPNNFIPVYDAILIDEAQDMPASFFKLIYKCVNGTKRIVWAYDELQNLGSTSMPSIEDMFGIDNEGNPKIKLKNEDNHPFQDIILPICYRNPPWILGLAHSLGFGIYREPLVQHFESLELWTDVGYKVESGKLDFGKEVTLVRDSNSTPQYFYDLLKSNDAINIKGFDDEESQFQWVANQIRINIQEEELDPDDILVIFPSAITAKSKYLKFSYYLNQMSIDSILTGVTNDKETFRIKDSITCSAIYRAKGNEAPMVYVLNSEYCNSGYELIKLRNTLFTAITRSRAWVRVCGVGPEMVELEDEMNRYITMDYSLKYKIPLKAQMNVLRTINRERTLSEKAKIEEAKKGVKLFIDLVNRGEIEASQIPEFDSLMKLMLSNIGKNDLDDEIE